jgi:NADH:ubiquinone oxidoreductase subunit 5 (subunit L)/multisubunit Na+/H+ antiporter MnhA subunit
MLWPVYALAALAAVGGLLQIPGVTPLHDRLPRADHVRHGEMVEPSVAQEYLTTAAAVAAGLLGAALAFRLWGRRPSVIAERPATGLAVVAERRFFWDELYDLILYRPAAAGANLIRRFIERPFFEAPLDAVGPASRSSRAASASRRPASCGSTRSSSRSASAPCSCCSWCRRPDGRPLDQRHGPDRRALAGAVLLALLPISRALAAYLATLVALAVAGAVAGLVYRFDIGGGEQFVTDETWVESLGIRFHVGIDGLSLAMVAVTALVMACVIGYAAWEGGARTRPYYALLLLLESALLLLFTRRT